MHVSQVTPGILLNVFPNVQQDNIIPQLLHPVQPVWLIALYVQMEVLAINALQDLN